MATLLHRLGRGSYHHRRVVVAVWLVVLAALVACAGVFARPTATTFSIPGLESTDALSRLQERFGGPGDTQASARVVFAVPAGATVTGPASAAALERTVASLRSLPQVASVTDPLAPTAPTVSPDRRAAYSTVTYRVATADITTASRARLLAVVARSDRPGLTTVVGGDAVTNPGELGGAGEVAGVLVAVLVLVLTYGTLVAAGLNLLTALVGVGSGIAGITAATALVDLQSTTTVLALMLGLAVGIDYGLFILSRLRAELLRGAPMADAVGLAVGTAGSAVVTAGATVVIALAGLSVVGIPFLTQMGVAAAATVAVAVLIALTLLPAVTGFLGPRVLPRRQRRRLAGPSRGARPAEHAARRSGLLPAWARAVTRAPVASLVGVVVLLGVLAVPLASLRTSLGDDSTAPLGSQQRRAYDVVSAPLAPSPDGPLLVLAEGAGAAARGEQLADGARGLRDVAAVLGPQVTRDGTAALVTVVPRSGPSSPATTALVHRLRALPADTGAPAVAVTGQTAVSVDVSARLQSALPEYLVLVVGLALVLLVLVFRSLLVPLTAVVGFLLTIGAALGATVAVFQWGWVQQLVDTRGTAPILSLAPIIVVGILFGLAMDYEIFIVSRIHEAHRRGEAARTAVTTGFGRAAPVVVAAATIMFSVFAGFVPGGDPTVKPIAFALAVGVLADAFVVRMVAVPAALALLGDTAWWLPRWLAWLPRLDVEGSALEPAAVSSGTGDQASTGPGRVAAPGTRTGATAAVPAASADGKEAAGARP